MITFEKECYAIYVGTDERSSALLGYFTSETDGLRAAKGKGWWGGDGSATRTTVTVIIFESLEEYETGLTEKLRQSALSKLTDDEKKLLGL